MNRLLLGVAFAAVAINTASAASKLDTKLSVEVDKQGRVTATLQVTNNGNHPVCFLAHEMLVMLDGADGKSLGDVAEVDFLVPNSIDVVWEGGYPQTFNLSINGGHYVNGDTVLTPAEIRNFVRARAYFSGSDCIDFLANQARPKHAIKRELTASPTFDTE